MISEDLKLPIFGWCRLRLCNKCLPTVEVKNGTISSAPSEKPISLEMNHHITVAGEGKVQPDGCQMAEGTTGVAVAGTGRQLDTCAIANGA